jgi:hypothetical protein
MSLSPRSVETLLDLVEIKLSCLEVQDREDARELAILETARRELAAITTAARSTGQVVPMRGLRRMPMRATA